MAPQHDCQKEGELATLKTQQDEHTKALDRLFKVLDQIRWLLVFIALALGARAAEFMGVVK